MQFVAECLRSCTPQRFAATGVDSKNRCAGEAEDMIVLECLDDFLVHIAELGSVAFIEDQYDMLLVDVMPFIFPDKDIKFLDGSNDNAGVRVFKLFLQHFG